MNTTTTSPLVSPLPPHEKSSLRSDRDSDSVNKLWYKLSETIKLANNLSQISNQQNRDIKRLGERHVTDFDFFPFEIYTVPYVFRPDTDTAQYTSSINWRTVRVRGGFWLSNTVSTASLINGTDGMQNYAYNNFLANNVGPYDIQVPAYTPQYWFWVENSASLMPANNQPPLTASYWLRSSATPQTPDNAYNPNGWINFPTASNSYVPVGYVDTNTSGSQNIAYVRQFLNGDILFPPSSNVSSSNNSSSILVTPTAIYNDYFKAVDINNVTYSVAKPPSFQTGQYSGSKQYTVTLPDGVHTFTSGSINTRYEITTDPNTSTNAYSKDTLYPNYLTNATYTTKSYYTATITPFSNGIPGYSSSYSGSTVTQSLSYFYWLDITPRMWATQTTICNSGSNPAYILTICPPYGTSI